MSRRRHERRLIPAPPRRKKILKSLILQIDVRSLLNDAKDAEASRQYLWDYEFALEFQRMQNAEAIRSAILGAAEGPFEFDRWQRVVKFKYTQNPLSPAGSLLVSGRFNYSDFNPDKFPPFPALYLAQGRATAMSEALGQSETAPGKLSAFELAMTNTASIAVLEVRGKLEHVIDLRKPDRLQPLLDIIKGFTIPDHVVKQAKSLNLQEPKVVQSVSDLKQALLAHDWRWMNMLGDVPATNQVFGQMVAQAGIDGIIYPSKIDGEPCLAAFPTNFQNSFIEIAGDAPPGLIAKRLDASTWPLIQKGR